MSVNDGRGLYQAFVVRALEGKTVLIRGGITWDPPPGAKGGKAGLIGLWLGEEGSPDVCSDEPTTVRMCLLDPVFLA